MHYGWRRNDRVSQDLFDGIDEVSVQLKGEFIRHEVDWLEVFECVVHPLPVDLIS